MSRATHRQQRRAFERRPGKAERAAAKRRQFQRIKGNTMKIDFTERMLDMDDKPILLRYGVQDVMESLLLAGVNPNAAKQMLAGITGMMDDKKAKREDLTFAAYISNCLASQDKEVNWDEADERMALARLIRKATGALELDKKDFERIQECVERVCDLPMQLSSVKRLLDKARAAEKAAEGKAGKAAGKK